MSVGEEDAAAQPIIIVRRSGGHDDGHHGGVWKIAFADFMTALMAFFLVMWLVNAANRETKRMVASYFNPLKLSDTIAAPKGLKKLQPGEKATVTQEKPETGSESEKKLSGENSAVRGDKNNQSPEGTSELSNPSQSSSERQLKMSGDAELSAVDPFLIKDSEPATKASGIRDSGQDLASADSKLAVPERTAPPTPTNAQGDKNATANKSEAVDSRYEVTEGDKSDVAAKQTPAGSTPDTAQPAPGSAEVMQGSAQPVQGAAKSQQDKVQASKDVAQSPQAGVQPAQTADQSAQSDAKSGQGIAQASKAGPHSWTAEVVSDNGKSELEKEKERDFKRKVERAKTRIQEALHKVAGGGPAPSLRLEAKNDGVLISLTDNETYEMFDRGSSQPNGQLMAFMQRVGSVIKEYDGRIIVSGHTDARPFTSGANNNWRLSFDRAHEVFQMLKSDQTLASRFSRIEGYAATKLRDTANPFGSKNRRVEIFIELKKQ